MLDPIMVSNVLGDEVGKEVTVKFLKDNDEERTYTGLINSKVGLKNNERGKTTTEMFEKHGIVPLKTLGGYKSFKVHRVLAMKTSDRHIYCMGSHIED
tara:strand:- start:1072 stop:1365 length:294 start_codon:yes stop_codon:yes gene_type:complete